MDTPVRPAASPDFPPARIRRRRPRRCTDAPADARAVRAMLAALPFPILARAVAALLCRLGYADVRLADRVRAGERRNRDGGCDILMRCAPGAAGLAIVQIKRYAPGFRIHRRQVDELVGAAVRAGASEAVLIATGDVAPSVRPGVFPARQRTMGTPAAPRVRVIAGDELAEMMVRHAVLPLPLPPPPTSPPLHAAAPPREAREIPAGRSLLRLCVTVGVDPLGPVGPIEPVGEDDTGGAGR